MGGTGASARTGLSDEERADRLWEALRPVVAEAMRKSNIRAGAGLDDIEASSAAAGDLAARALMEAACLEFGRATDDEVEEAKREVLSKAEPELVSNLGVSEPRLVRQMRERTLRTERGPVRCRREHLCFPDLRVGLSPPRLPS